MVARVHWFTSDLTGHIQIHGMYRRRRFQLSKLQDKRRLAGQPNPGSHPLGYRTVQVLPGQTTFDGVQIH